MNLTPLFVTGSLAPILFSFHDRLEFVGQFVPGMLIIALLALYSAHRA